MKYVVATQQGQGIRKNDFFWANEGEPVLFGSQCSHATVDDYCGCARAMCGVHSAKATTTMRVANMDAVEVLNHLREHYMKNWGYEDDMARELAERQFLEIAIFAAKHEIGTIIELRENGLQPRGEELK